jgi:enamine deaminase RidA (YjgF/YER057c/UK114 family)
MNVSHDDGMNTAVSLIRADGLCPSVPYAYAATAPENARLVFLAGACPLDTDGRTVAPGDIEAQAAACMANMTIALDAAGATISDVVFIRVLVASSSRSDLGMAWNVVHDAFESHDVPGTLQGVTVLGWERQLVEIEAVAALVD